MHVIVQGYNGYLLQCFLTGSLSYGLNMDYDTDPSELDSLLLDPDKIDI